MWRLPQRARIAAVYPENYRTKTFVLDASLQATPGQFVMLWLPRFDEKPFSLVACDPLTVMITAVGPFSRLMHDLNVGDRVWVRGPLGRGYSYPEQGAQVVLVGGGYGVAPLYWLAHHLAHVCVSVHSIVGARTAADLLYTDRFARLPFEDTPGAGPFALHVTTEDGSQGYRGRVTDVLGPMLASGQVDEIFACGPNAMLAAIETQAAQSHVACQLLWEEYMRCAIGICGACEHRGKLLCLDGPVVKLQSHHLHAVGA
jgi:dihydroorotate dehydrogenase electron transfer subunit